MGRRLLLILGPTAVGKTDFSIEKALEVGSPVISCDSRQLYKEMHIGTAVPSPEQLARVPHYFIQTLSVTQNYTAGMYEADALALIGRLFAEGHETLVVTGGSMMYADALCYGLDDFPEVPMLLREHLMECLRDEGVEVLADQLKELDPVTYDEIDLSNGQRVIRALEVCLYTGQPFSSFKTRSFKERAFEIEKIGLQRPREELYARIDARVLHMMRKRPGSLFPTATCQPSRRWATAKCSSISTGSTTWRRPSVSSSATPGITPSASSPGGAATRLSGGLTRNRFPVKPGMTDYLSRIKMVKHCGGTAAVRDLPSPAKAALTGVMRSGTSRVLSS